MTDLGSKVLYQCYLLMFVIFFSKRSIGYHTHSILCHCYMNDVIMVKKFRLNLGPMIYASISSSGIYILCCDNSICWKSAPSLCFIDPTLYQTDLRGKHNQDWCKIYEEYIMMWHTRHDHRAQGEATHEPTVSYDYFSWYKSNLSHQWCSLLLHGKNFNMVCFMIL